MSVDLEALRAALRRRARSSVISVPEQAEAHAILAALERIPELEGRIRDKNCELTGVHEALRKETERVERLEAALKELLAAEANWLERALEIVPDGEAGVRWAAAEDEARAVLGLEKPNDA